MKKINIVLSLFTISAVAGIITYAKSQGIAVLEPQGVTSAHQQQMFWLSVGLGLLALIPVFILTIAIVSRYRANKSGTGKPVNHNWDVKPHASWIWASFVSLIILVLAVFMYKSTFAVDPYKPLASENETMTIRVVALPWKWLFIYPEQDLASVSELVIPVNTPILFEHTADAPMSSFWIPKLGGMIYTMEGMVTKLNLKATSIGEFEGMNTEINGEGYSGMRFKTKAVSDKDFEDWVAKVKRSDQVLDDQTYQGLTKPSVNESVKYYSATDPALFGKILAKFMNHSNQNSNTSNHNH